MTEGGVAVAYIHPGTVTGVFHTSLLNLLLYDISTEQRIVPRGGHLASRTPSGRIPEGRNALVKEFLQLPHEPEWLWMVDADMGFEPDVVDRLVAAADPDDVPVLGGLCFGQQIVGEGPAGATRFRPFPTLYRYVDTGEQVGFAHINDYERDAVVQVAGTGAACLLIHRTVLERVREAYGESWFALMSIKGTVFSEDLSFCVRVAAVGATVHVDTSVKISHEKNVFLDEAHYDAHVGSAVQAPLDPVPAEV